MLSKQTLEQRLETLEQVVAGLQATLSAKQPSSKNWLDNLTGSISDEAAFLEALEYGRQMRQADRPTTDDIDQT
ncbi:MAG: transferase hexapeptide repeat containing protein [Cyanobacteria bacterium J06627_28]